MTGTVFPNCSVKRSESKWEEHMDVLTPVETTASGRRYKREDFFAPLGYGGPNGAKLRQLIHLVLEYRAAGGNKGIATAASVLSPQLSMAAIVARHYGLQTVIALGATKPKSAVKHPNVEIAAMAGASFAFTKVGFNPALQRFCDDLCLRPEYRGFYRLHYGITTAPKAKAEDLERFHSVGARQTRNIPDDIKTLYMPAGSCNSCTSVLLGIHRNPPKSLRRIVLLGIGPTRLLWVKERLQKIGRLTGDNIWGRFDHRFHDHPDLEAPPAMNSRDFLLEHHDLHSTGYCGYQDRMPFESDGIRFHPTYEGKCMTFMRENRTAFRDWWDNDGSSMFWIVGSKPKTSIFRKYLS